MTITDMGFEFSLIHVLKQKTEYLVENYISLEAVVRRCSVKKVFLEILQNSQENTCAGISFFIKLQASGVRPGTGAFL